MALQLPNRKVLDWLGADAKGVPYYLHPLNLVWSDEGVDYDLEVFRRVAEILRKDPTYWAEIIRGDSWRHSLAGCACLLASSRREFFDDLCFRFRKGSFITPQIAVTLGLLHGAASKAFLESVLNDPKSTQKPKQAASACQVLIRLGSQIPDQNTASAWSGLELDEAMLAEKVVTEHWDFWGSRL